MSPPASTTASQRSMPPPPRPTHSRPASAASVKQPQQQVPSKAPSPRPSTEAKRSNVHYTCFIRLPFPRNGFEDPAPVEWDTVKDAKLWKMISKAPNPSDLDWDAIAERFAVSKAFLFQQAAWLMERHFEGMRKVMRMGATAATSNAPSPAPPESQTSSGQVASKAFATDPRLPSAINTLKAAEATTGDSSGSSPGTPRFATAGKPEISRTPSATTVTQSRQMAGSGGKQPLQRAFRGSSGSQRRPQTLARPFGSAQDNDEYALGHDGPSDSGSEDEPPSRSQAFRRPPLGKKPVLRTLSSDGDAEDDDEDSPGRYLPFAAASSSTKRHSAKDEMAATLKGKESHSTAQAYSSREKNSRGKAAPPPPPPLSSEDDPSSSAASSSVTGPSPHTEARTNRQQEKPGPISPQYREQLASLSPRSRKTGSEGSPSMGSSFSDLEGDSVTQSALESALADHMRDGGSLVSGLGSIASRVGSIGRNLGGGRRQ